MTPPARCHQRLGPCPSLAVGSGRGDLSVWQRSVARRGAAGLPVPRGWFPLAPSAPAGAARDTGYFESWCVGLGRHRGFGSRLFSSPVRVFDWGGGMSVPGPVSLALGPKSPNQFPMTVSLSLRRGWESDGAQPCPTGCVTRGAERWGAQPRAPSSSGSPKIPRFWGRKGLKRELKAFKLPTWSLQGTARQSPAWAPP